MAAVVLAGLACPKAAEQKPLIGGVGKPIAVGAGADLRATPDRKFLTFLRSPVRPALDGVPQHLALGELVVTPSLGGTARSLGPSVSNAPGGYGFSPDSRYVLFLRGYNAASRQGELTVADLTDASRAPIPLGGFVSFFIVSDDSRRVAFVDAGVLKVSTMGEGSAKQISGEVSTADFLPGGRQLLYRRTYAAGGGLFLTSVEGAKLPVKLVDRSGDYQTSPDGNWIAYSATDPDTVSQNNLFLTRTNAIAPRKLALRAGKFSFSPDSKSLAFLDALSRDGSFGTLIVQPVTATARPVDPRSKKAERPGQIGEAVATFSFAPDSHSIAAVVGYRIESRDGRLVTASAPDWKPKPVSAKANAFEWSPDSKHLVFNILVTRPLPSVYLYVQTMGEEKPRKIEDGAYGFAFVPATKQLLFRSECSKGEGGVMPRSCVLKSLDLSRPADPPKAVTESIYSFKPSADGSRLLVTYVRTDADAYDTAVLDLKTGNRKTLDTYTLLPGLFLDDGGDRVAYLISVAKRSGLYVADVKL